MLMPRGLRIFLCITASLILVLSSQIPALGNTEETTIRVSGQDRYATAAAIAHTGWTQSDYAIIVSGDNYPDALVSAVTAKQFNAPILLATKKSLPSATKQTLTDLQVKCVILIGGTAVLSNTLQLELQKMGITVTRWAGPDRYATSVVVASQSVNTSEIFITSGDGFTDALSVSSIAACKNVPIILVSKDRISPEAEAYIQSHPITNTYVIGDTDIISDNVAQMFPNPERITGVNKYDRNIAVINRFGCDVPGPNVMIATGEDYADALSGSAYAAKTNSPIVLVSSTLSASTRSYFDSNTSGKTLCILGGESAISNSTIDKLISENGYRYSNNRRSMKHSREWDNTSDFYPEESSDPLLDLGYTEEKYILVFGSLSNPVYPSATESVQHMTTISVDVWLLKASGEKYSGKRTLTVNKAIADRIQSVFKEIYEGPEKFPIYSVQGYAWRPEPTSEHRWGLAVDINPNENYMITNTGVIKAGSFWKPGISPYSIPLNGDVVNAFNKYGFTWGGNAWHSSNDYMHFSYLGR
ncbi:cell wall-binding repeat-containing protein [Dehalobacter sp. DCM]|uniref:cell wall-binding repeat-containing protein n=1 Tax=Dehalobacter sp. DCM TaxID=2907827 RepID=UPI003081D6FD|nr:cell wall-binding repeat-containing protein [Dehalobacter sp. DCM]